jgi:hypothetical protein
MRTDILGIRDVGNAYRDDIWNCKILPNPVTLTITALLVLGICIAATAVSAIRGDLFSIDELQNCI